jgi:hypothetical protein
MKNIISKQSAKFNIHIFKMLFCKGMEKGSILRFSTKADEKHPLKKYSVFVLNDIREYKMVRGVWVGGFHVRAEFRAREIISRVTYSRYTVPHRDFRVCKWMYS